MQHLTKSPSKLLRLRILKYYPGAKVILKSYLSLVLHYNYQMCVDDYEFKHFSARREKICRKFIIVNEDEVAKTYYVNISQFEQHGQVALCKILIYLSTKGLTIENKKFYLPKFSAIIEPFTFCKIVFEALDESEIFLKTYPASKETSQIFAQNENIDTDYEEKMEDNSQNYYCRFEEDEYESALNIEQYKLSEHNHHQNTMEEEMPVEAGMVDEAMQSSKGSESDETKRAQQTHKKLKQSERVIRQVIIGVRVWRQLHDSKRCNLTNAAKVVGISKKSLDDYYLVLRVGEILGFDFANNLDHKMGDLRNFIRHKQQKITGKLGKNVECFSCVDQQDLDKLVQEYQTSSKTLF